MDNYRQENQLGWSLSSLIGIFLTMLGVGVLLWVVISIYLLFTENSSFLLMDEMLPDQIFFGQFDGGELLVPREFFLFGVPLSALSIGARIGISLLKNGGSLFEKPNRKNRG